MLIATPTKPFVPSWGGLKNRPQGFGQCGQTFLRARGVPKEESLKSQAKKRRGLVDIDHFVEKITNV